MRMHTYYCYIFILEKCCYNYKFEITSITTYYYQYLTKQMLLDYHFYEIFYEKYKNLSKNQLFFYFPIKRF